MSLKVAVFSSKAYDQAFLEQANSGLELHFLEARLTVETCQLAEGHQAICVFVNDELDAQVLQQLANYGVRHIALRCAGFNNVDLSKAEALGLQISRVPAYSPEAVAEHTLALIMTLNRRLHKAYNRIKEDNFALNGLLGFNLHGKTVGIIGTGKIGVATLRILKGFGCQLLCHDPQPDPQVVKELGADYVSLEQVLQQSQVISLHCPLTTQTQHMINQQSLALMQDGVMLINTSRGGLLDTNAVIQALKSKKVGYLGLDVYEMESELFFEDKSCDIIQDDTFQRLLTFPNVLITGHQGFFTREAMQHIAHTSINNLLSPNTQPKENFLLD